MSGGRRRATTFALVGLGAELIRDLRARTTSHRAEQLDLDEPSPEAPAPPIGRGIRVARGVLIGFGVAGLTFAGYLVVTTITPRGLTSAGIWLVGCLVLHDGVLSPIVLVANQVLRRAGRRIPGVVLAIVQVAVIVGVFVTFVVLPEIRAKQVLVRNPTVLPFDYPLRLGLFWAAIVVVTAVVVAVVLALRRRRARSVSDPMRPIAA